MRKSFSILFAFMTMALTITSCSSSDDDTVQQSSLAEITDFSLTFESADANDIDYDLGSDITVSVPYGTPLTGVIPNIAISENASIDPASGEPINFVDGEPMIFTVTAEDGTENQYSVIVEVRGEVGSGTRLKTYTVNDIFFGVSTNTYSYNEANFVEEISEETDSWGTTITTVYSFVYNDKNQITRKNVEGTEDHTIYFYEDSQIVKAEESVDGALQYTYIYTYNDAGDLISEKRTDHSDEDSVSETIFTVENGNVVKQKQYSLDYTATYDDKNNPFREIYPSAFAAINIGIEAVNVNNPLTGSIADGTINYEYNEDGFPVSASYAYPEIGGSVEKIFTYYAE